MYKCRFCGKSFSDTDQHLEEHPKEKKMIREAISHLRAKELCICGGEIERCGNFPIDFTCSRCGCMWARID